MRALPGARMLATYRPGWLRRDLVAGLVLATLLVPQGMAYAQLAGLPAITGLYTTILCLVGYAAFGPSRILVLGPDSSLGPMIAATIIPIVGSNGDPGRAIALASLLALIVGAIMIVAGIARLGFVADLLSKPTRIGYINGLALTILIGQLPKLFGFSVSGTGLIDEARGFVEGLADGKAVGAAVAVGLLSLALILVCSRVLPRVPGVLVAVVIAIAASGALDLGDHGVSLVGTLPSGFPPFTVPDSASDLRCWWPARVGHRHRGAGRHHLHGVGVRRAHGPGCRRQRRDDRHRGGERRGRVLPGLPGEHERLAHGGGRAGGRQDAAHRRRRRGGDRAHARVRARVCCAASRSRRWPPSSSPRRCRWPTSRAWCGCGASAAWSSCSRWRRSSASRSLACSRASPSRSSCRSSTCSGGPGGRTRRRWARSRAWPASTTASCIRRPSRSPASSIFRFDAPLFFANARTFRDQIRALAAADPRPRWIVIAAEPITDVDTTAADMLHALDEELNAAGINLVFAELKDPVREKLERYELIGHPRPRPLLPHPGGRRRELRRRPRSAERDALHRC